MTLNYTTTIHTGRGSFRVPGNVLGWMQNEISRIFEVANVCRVDDNHFEDTYKLVVSVDHEVESLGYHRYDCISEDGIQFLTNIESIHSKVLNTIESAIGRTSFLYAYKEILVSQLFYQVDDIRQGCLKRNEISGCTCLLVRFDVDKTAMIIIVTDTNVFENIGTIRQKSFEWASSIGFETTFHVFLYADIDNGGSLLLPSKEYFMLRYDDFVMLLNQDNIALKELYYYWLDRDVRYELLQGQEIEIICSYLDNKQTFYSYPNSFGPAFGNPNLYCKMKCNWEQKNDLHLIWATWGYCMISKFTDFHSWLPIYKPASSSNQDLLVCEYLASQVIIQSDSDEADKKVAYHEIAKSLLVWILAIECRFREPLISDNVHVVIKICNTEKFQVRKYKQVYMLIIPEDYLMDDKLKDYVEQTTLKNLLDGLRHFEVCVADDYIEKLKIVFSECDGHIIQICDHPNVLLTQDGIRDTYNLSDRYCDAVLDDISEFLNMKGEEIVLSVQSSGEIANKIQDYLKDRIYQILQDKASVKLMTYLLRLEHSLLFWQCTSQGRYINIERLLEYMGVNFESQIEYANQYAVVSNLTKLFIERLVKEEFPLTNNRMTCTDFDLLFALAHQYYNISMYLDILRVEGEDARLTILSNGRFALPTKCLDKGQLYLSDLRNSEYDGIEKHLAMYRSIPEFTLNPESSDFQDAFLDEFGITYDDYMKILGDCISYGMETCNVVVLSEVDFERKFFQDCKVDYAKFKKHLVLSKKTAKKLKYSEFAVHRHNRLFQLSTRPWVLYNGEVYFSYKILYRHWFILKDRIEHGRFRAVNDKMISFIGNINRRKGDAFNDALYDYYCQCHIQNLHVYKNVKIAAGKLLDADEDKGDIDLLLIDTEKKQILCVELKNYRECRSVLDLYEQSHKADDDLVNVIKRDAWCKSNIEQFCKIDKNVSRAYSLRTCFLTYNMQAVNYVRTKDYPDIQFYEMRSLIDAPESILNR